MSFLEPQPALYAFIFAQSFVYVPLIALLALVRVSVARGPARWAAFGAMVLASGAIFLQFGPAFMGLYEGALPVFAGWATRWGGGIFLPLLPSLPLAASAFLRGARWWVIDAAHLLAALALLGLFAYVRLL